MTQILADLEWRGLLAQTTDRDALSSALASPPLTFYCGFDPTAASLHIGHLIQILTMRRLQLSGHRPLALVGGATGLIGDPKPTSERQLVDRSVVTERVVAIRGQLEAFLDFSDSAHGAVMVNNLDWTEPMSAIDLLRDIGKHFSVNRMLDRDAVKTRLEGEGISYTEFSYVLLQSLDYLELYRRHDCRLQIGGSDQWGNITAGADLVRRVEADHVHVLTTQLLTKSDGTKFGKTEGGAVWLDPAMTSPYAFYQFWLNADDRDVPRLLRMFSFRSHDEIEELERSSSETPQARAGQRALAEELTTLVHGIDETTRVVEASRALFGQGDLAGLDAGTLRAALAEAGTTRVAATQGLSVTELLAETGLAPSRSAARRTVAEGGAYLNNVRVEDGDHVPTTADSLHGSWLVLRRGRKSFAGVELV